MAAQHSHSSPRYIYNILTEHTFLGSYYLKSEFVVRTGGYFFVKSVMFTRFVVIL